LNSHLQNFVTRQPVRKSALLLLCGCLLLAGCRGRQHPDRPALEFSSVPPAEEGGPEKLDVIEGRVTGAPAGSQIVLFARSGAWYVQPYADQPFTRIQQDSKWRSPIHLGTEYAALLVEPGYQPPVSIEVLPGEGNGVIAVAVTRGERVFWQRWWFLFLCLLAFMSTLLAAYSYRLHQATRQLQLRFEERLAERSRVAQELHDVLLQGIISASMQLHIAVERLPEDLPEKPSLTHVLQVMEQVLEEGRTALQQLRSSASMSSLDVEQAFSKIRQEFATDEQSGFQISVKGSPRPVHPVIRDEVYRIGREALVNAFRHARARQIEVEVDYRANQLRIVVTDDGRGIDRGLLKSGGRGHGGLLRMRQGAERIGARLRQRRRAAAGTRIELSVPGHIAYPGQARRNLWNRLTGRWRQTPARKPARERQEDSI
jgi:signal transduction histidine kinase